MRILTFLLLLLQISVQAQKIRVDNNRLTVNDELWCTITEKKGKSNYKSIYFKGTDGKLWMEAHHVYLKIPENTSLYKLTFPLQKRDVYYKPGMDPKGTLAAQLVKSGAFTKTGPYEQGIDKFERNFGLILPELKKEPLKQDAKHTVTIVQRNRSASIFVINGEVKQDFKLVATYKEETKTENDTLMSVVVFTDIKGVQIARAGFEHVNGETATLFINGNPEPMIINLNKGTNAMKIEEIAKQLIAIGKM